MDLCNISVIKHLCQKYGFNFSKSLGQNFLINPEICPKIADIGNANKDSGIIEIGTGFGVLTSELAKKAKKVVAIEIDKTLLPVLEETLSEFDNISIINNDVLKVDMHALINDEFNGMDVSVCANLPYYITSPIIMGILEQRLPIKSLTVMVQKEAADRLCAEVGTRACSGVSFAVRYYCNPVLLFNVNRDSFTPSPNVDSAVIRLDINESTPQNVLDESFLFKVVKLAFSQRRKTLANPVSAGLGVKKDVIFDALDAISQKRTARAEEMSFDDFINFSNYLYELKTNK